MPITSWIASLSRNFAYFGCTKSPLYSSISSGQRLYNAGACLRGLNKNIAIDILHGRLDARLATSGSYKMDFYHDELQQPIGSIQIHESKKREEGRYLVGTGGRTIIDAEVGRHSDLLRKVQHSLTANM